MMIYRNSILCLSYKSMPVYVPLSGQTANGNKRMCAFVHAVIPRQGRMGKQCASVFPGPGWNVTVLQPGPQQLRLAPRSHHRCCSCCCRVALVSCAHSPPPRLCFCWPGQRGAQLKARGLGESFHTRQGRESPEKVGYRSLNGRVSLSVDQSVHNYSNGFHWLLFRHYCLSRG